MRLLHTGMMAQAASLLHDTPLPQMSRSGTRSMATCAHCVSANHRCAGFIVNPDGLRNQIEGNVIQATSRALFEEVRFDERQVTSVDRNSYPIIRFNDVPQVAIRLIDRKNERIAGAGEATTTVIAPAIANAVFAQTGARLRSVPFTPHAVKAALAG